jgi:O-methyltransferase involved in polyketide biosynthesis
MKAGNIIRFGDYDWQVLEVQEGKALIITTNNVEERHYGDSQNPAWEKCSLRKYLNDEFLKKFTPEEQAQIIETSITRIKLISFGFSSHSRKAIRPPASL